MRRRSSRAARALLLLPLSRRYCATLFLLVQVTVLALRGASAGRDAPHGAVMQLLFGGPSSTGCRDVPGPVITMRLVAEERAGHAGTAPHRAGRRSARWSVGKYLGALVFWRRCGRPPCCMCWCWELRAACARPGTDRGRLPRTLLVGASSLAIGDLVLHAHAQSG